MKTNLYEIENFFREELIKAGVRFTSDGYPIFQEEWILYETPKYIYPYEHRNATTDKKNTVLCFFMNDKPLYKRIIKLPDDLNNYRDYLGVIGFDLSPVIGWQTDYQRFNILLSQLATAYLGINGIKIIPNFRIGNISTISALDSYPKNIPYGVGMLSCNRRKVQISDIGYFSTKLLYAMPCKLYIYGTLKKETKDLLDELNISYTVYIDFRTKCFSVYKKGEKNERCKISI